MKVLWSVNCAPPDIAKLVGLKSGHAISWVAAMRNAISANRRDIELVIVCNGGKELKTLKVLQDKNVTYYILPQNNQLKSNWKKIMDEVCPDIIHAYGTERRHNIPLIEQYADKIPIIISLQGLLTEYVKHYYAFISVWGMTKNNSLDVFLHGRLFIGKLKFFFQSKKEQQMLCCVRFVEGRSDWDKAVSLEINHKLKYYYCPRMIRKPFFEYQWNKEKYEPHSLFVHQGNYPIKGLHFMLDALNIVRRKYPDVKLYVSGNSFMNRNRLKENGYIRYIRKKIDDLKLSENIIFTGYLTADELAKKLVEVNACVIPSAIENAPNALAEAMIVGTPCIASYVGGNAEMLDYGKLGLLYCYYEPQLLAERIDKMFSNENVAVDFSEKARQFARKKHDPITLEQTLLDIYNDAIVSFKTASIL